MERQEYIEMRKRGEISYELLLEYYLKHAKVPITKDVREFQTLWNINMTRTHLYPPQQVQELIRHVVSHYDNKYKVMLLMDKDSKVINVV